MAIDPSAEMFKQMGRPDFYPHPASTVEIRETHISKVFLAGEFVYKVKKSLNLEFLDFTTLENRRYFCLQEVSLNRRLTEDVYLGVVPITFDDGVYRLDGGGPAVEYAVKMRRLPEDCTMAHLLEVDGLHQEEINRLADVLVAFYDRPEEKQQAERFGTWEIVSANCDKNFAQTARYAGKLFDGRRFAIVRAAVKAFLRRRKSLFDQRLASGKIRDCHGDLRAEHIYFVDNRIQIIDCIEFNPCFRYEDVASDLAFLAMDLDSRGKTATASSLLMEYVHRTEDADLFVLIEFYQCYRAMVRFKVNCIRAMAPDVAEAEKTHLLDEIEKYLDLAYGYAARFTRPVLWVICGMPASGKSTIAEQLGEVFQIPVLRSDMIRKQNFASPDADLSNTAFERGIYSKGMTALTYGRLLLLAQDHIEKGSSVVLDATFGARHFRREVLRLAEDMDASIFFVECIAPEAVLKKRLAARKSGSLLSDARISHFDAFCQSFEPLDEIHPDQHIVVDTEKSIHECMARILYDEYMTAT
ncbi:MAG: AAA family ATPase [Desulfosalsimonadaceae bacterium]